MNSASDLQNRNLDSPQEVTQTNNVKFGGTLDNSNDNYFFDAISGGFTKGPSKWPSGHYFTNIYQPPDPHERPSTTFGLSELGFDF